MADEPILVAAELLAGWPLPEPGSSKHARGTVLLVGGSSGVPGAMVLAGEAALRAGGGRLQVITTESVASPMAVSIPEALVAEAPEGPSGDITSDAVDQIVGLADKADAVLLGPGMTSPDVAASLVGAVVSRLSDQAVVLDAVGTAAVTRDRSCLHHLESPAVLTLNPTELALTLGKDRDEVEQDPVENTLQLAHEARTVVLFGGSTKYVGAPDGRVWKVDRGCPGLGVSGSGDVQAGIVAGLLARDAEPAQAAVWGAWLHGRSGEVLADRVGPVGFLARELPATVPGLLAEGSHRDE
jgi:ADP-dependent NAD(P)H-hydrate dehydratase